MSLYCNSISHHARCANLCPTAPPPPPHENAPDAMMAAVRADYDAKVAELKADLEATRSEKEKMDTDLAYLKVRFVIYTHPLTPRLPLCGRLVQESSHRHVATLFFAHPLTGV